MTETIIIIIVIIVSHAKPPKVLPQFSLSFPC